MKRWTGMLTCTALAVIWMGHVFIEAYVTKRIDSPEMVEYRQLRDEWKNDEADSKALEVEMRAAVKEIRQVIAELRATGVKAK